MKPMTDKEMHDELTGYLADIFEMLRKLLWTNVGLWGLFWLWIIFVWRPT